MEGILGTGAVPAAAAGFPCRPCLLQIISMFKINKQGHLHHMSIAAVLTLYSFRIGVDRFPASWDLATTS